MKKALFAVLLLAVGVSAGAYFYARSLMEKIPQQVKDNLAKQDVILDFEIAKVELIRRYVKLANVTLKSTKFPLEVKLDSVGVVANDWRPTELFFEAAMGTLLAKGKVSLTSNEWSANIENPKVVVSGVGNEVRFDATDVPVREFLPQIPIRSGQLTTNGVINDGRIQADYQLKRVDFGNASFETIAGKLNHKEENELTVKAVGIIKDTVVGNLTTSMKLFFRGGSEAEIKKSLRGSGDYTLTNAEVRSISLTRKPLEDLQKIPFLGMGVLQTKWDEHVKDMKGTFQIANGKVAFSDIIVVSPQFEATGKDTVVDLEGNMRGNLTWVPKEGVFAKILLDLLKDEAGNPTVPLLLSGSFKQPKVAVVSGVLEKRLNEKLKKSFPLNIKIK